MSTFDDFMISEAVKQGNEMQQLREALAQARQQIEKLKLERDEYKQAGLDSIEAQDMWKKVAEAANQDAEELQVKLKDLLAAIYPIEQACSNLLGAFVSCDGPPITPHTRRLSEAISKAKAALEPK